MSNRSPHITNLLSSGGEGRIEPLLKGADRFEDRRQQEVEQSPQLGQFILKRCAGEQKAVRRDVVGVEDLGQLAVMVLHSVTLVDDHVLPVNFS